MFSNPLDNFGFVDMDFYLEFVNIVSKIHDYNFILENMNVVKTAALKNNTD